MNEFFAIIIFALGVCIAFMSKVEAFINWNGNTWTRFCMWQGNDLNQAQVSSELCDYLCRRTQNCTHYTWSFKNGSTCFLKQNSRYRVDAVETLDPFTICGLVFDGVDWSNRNQAPSCDWNSRYLAKTPVAKDQCLLTCQRTSSCTHFSWTGGFCWLFTGVVDRTMTVHTTDTDGMCGYMPSSN